MYEVSEQNENPDGHETLENEGSAARTRPTSVEEIMLRRKRKECLVNVEGETARAAKLLGDDLVEKASAYHKSGKGSYRSKKVSREERVKNSSRKKEDTVSSSREERLDKPMTEDLVGAAQLLSNDLVEKVSDYHEYNTSENLRRDERLMDISKMKEDAISSSREETLDKPIKEDPVVVAQLLGNDLVEKVPDYHESEKLRREERVEDSSIKKEDATIISREGKLVKPMKEDPVGATQLLGNDLVENVPDNHESKKGYDRSEKLRHGERVKDSSRKGEDATSTSRGERRDKPLRKDPVGAAQLHRNDLVEKVSDYHASDKGHDRSTKVRREERAKDSSRKKEDAISRSREGKPIKEDPEGAALVEKVSNYYESEKVYDRSEKLRLVKESSRKSYRKEKLDKPKREEEPAANRKRKAEGEGSTAETKLVKEQTEDRQRKKEESNSSCREERQDKKMNKEDGHHIDTKNKARRESSAVRTIEKQIHPQETGGEQAGSVLENLSGSRKRLRSLLVAELPRDDENSIKPNNENKTENQNGDHKKNRERNTSQRHDPGKVHSVEVSERREKREHPKSHHRDVREKRRRSRSRDHGHDRQKRSSPEKATLRHKRDHEERSENAVKDRSEKHHFNDNENKVASTVNNKSKRYSSSKSELGGYSPRKRREEASAKAASPPNLSSEKKSAKWDLTPTVTADMFPGSVFSGLQAATQKAYPTISEASLTLLKPLMEAPFRTLPARQTTFVDPVQLTESTRRMRRLYADNVPDSASEKSLIECSNGYMLSSGSNHIKGSEPCISCIINKEKGQALVEFLTPQDASAALSLDGCSFAGSNLKIRRPKDFVETTSGQLEKKEPATNALSDDVEDSSNKIFIGGFPKGISSEMLLEILSVFGPLKAYRFVINHDLNQRSAFVEYADESITLKACAGLNGMKLGGSVITAVCALPDASSVTMNENPPFYGIPEHAKPLLGKPKHILKLKNVVHPEDFSSLSEQEVKEILEDVRLECARFGVIKSINIVEHQSKDITGSETNALMSLDSTDSKEMNVSVFQERDEEVKKAGDTPDNVDPGEILQPDSLTVEDKSCEPRSDTANTQANEDHDSAEPDHCEKTAGESAHEEEAENPQEEVVSARAVKTRWDSGEKKEEEEDPEDVFEPGCIFIEYGRPEATRDAAHSLHGRLYENRTVKAEYVSKELYQIRFSSG